LSCLFEKLLKNERLCVRNIVFVKHNFKKYNHVFEQAKRNELSDYKILKTNESPVSENPQVELIINMSGLNSSCYFDNTSASLSAGTQYKFSDLVAFPIL